MKTLPFQQFSSSMHQTQNLIPAPGNSHTSIPVIQVYVLTCKRTVSDKRVIQDDKRL